jgi:hypothetical protein
MTVPIGKTTIAITSQRLIIITLNYRGTQTQKSLHEPEEQNRSKIFRAAPIELAPSSLSTSTIYVLMISAMMCYIFHGT